MKNDELILTALISGAMTIVHEQSDPEIEQTIKDPYQHLTSRLLITIDTPEITECLSDPHKVITSYRHKSADWWSSVRHELVSAVEKDETLTQSAVKVVRHTPDIFRVLIRLPGGSTTSSEDDEAVITGNTQVNGIRLRGGSTTSSEEV